MPKEVWLPNKRENPISYNPNQILIELSDFIDVFNNKNIKILPSSTILDHKIPLINSESLSYRPIYPLS